MRRLMTAAVTLVAAATAASAGAQETVYWSAPPATTATRYVYFPTGTPLRLATRVELSTRESRPGDRFYLTVAEPLTYRGRTVVPAGALAAGEVVRADPTGWLGKRGEMAVRLLYVETPNGPVTLTGRAERAGKGQEVLAIGGALFVTWPMMFIHGTSAKLPADTLVTAYLADDLRFPAVPDAAPVTLAAAEPAVLPASFDPAAFSGVRR